jgi:alcohol dehydrogenase class IV
MAVFSLRSIPMGLSHAIGHQLGAYCDLPHGMCSAIMLPAVMDYNRPAAAARQRLVAEALHVDTSGLDDDVAARAAADRLRELVRKMGLRDRLGDWGIATTDLDRVASATLSDFMIGGNPRPVTDVEDIVALLRSVL